jgi:hypothetical protein
LSDVDIATIVIGVAVIAYPPLGLALVALGNATIYVALAAAATDLIGRLISNLGTEEGRDKVAKCQQDADDRLTDCLRSAAELGILRVPAETVCYADWLLGSALCLAT